MVMAGEIEPIWCCPRRILSPLEKYVRGEISKTVLKNPSVNPILTLQPLHER